MRCLQNNRRIQIVFRPNNKQIYHNWLTDISVQYILELEGEDGWTWCGGNFWDMMSFGRHRVCCFSSKTSAELSFMTMISRAPSCIEFPYMVDTRACPNGLSLGAYYFPLHCPSVRPPMPADVTDMKIERPRESRSTHGASSAIRCLLFPFRDKRKWHAK